MEGSPAFAVEQVHELRRRELIVAAVAEQVESVMSGVRSVADDDRWRGLAARAFTGAVDHRLRGLVSARRSLDVVGQALLGARWAAEQRAADLSAAGAAGG